MFSKKILILCMTLSAPLYAKAIIDSDVQETIRKSNVQLSQKSTPSYANTIIFLRALKDTDAFIQDIQKIDGVSVKKFTSIPAVLVTFPTNSQILEIIAKHPSAMQISSFQGGQEEMDVSAKAVLLKPSEQYPDLSNWWDQGYTGKNSILGLIDSGVDTGHMSLQNQKIIVRQEPGSGYSDFLNGVRSPHGTGVACIYAGSGNESFPHELGLSHAVPTILAGFAGDGDGNMDDLAQTLSTLDWMLNRAGQKPDVINYSFGNGATNCAECTDWSGLAKVMDYVINHHQILWVKSAGNSGYIPPAEKAPFAGNMSTPADNYNGLTVANMNPVLQGGILNPDRNAHTIRYTSSRGPTLKGRKKPDISAPGNDTRTCAPDPAIYNFSYPKSADYRNGYRLMGGTSAATPHVGAATLLLHDAGISSPMAKKALLINSADSWTDSGKSGPDDPKIPYEGGHYPVMGTEWNRTYGWGYMNMQKAYEQKDYIIEDTLTPKNPVRVYEVDLPVGGKITLVHERRVGYTNSKEWKLSHLKLEIINKQTGKLIMRDNSNKDSVHQVANCIKEFGEKTCSSKTADVKTLVKVTLVSHDIDGATEEPFAIASSVAVQ